MPNWAFPLRSAVSRTRRKDWLLILTWPAIALIMVALLWAITLRQTTKEKLAAETAIRNQAIAAANSYAQQLGHTIEQIDQITIRLKYSWEDPDIPVSLEKERTHGLFPESQLLYANIFNANGDLITSSLLNRERTNVAHQPYFQAHQANCCLGLLISEPSPSILLRRPIVRFTRRLNKPDGTFDGVAFISVELPYLVTFQESAAPGQNDFVSVRLTTGPLLANKVGSNTGALQKIYRHDPIFPALSGVTLERAENFQNGQAYFVAWKKLEKYPLVAVAGFSAKDALAPYAAQAKRYRETAALVSLLLLALSLAAAHFTARYVNRRRQTEDTQETYRLATDAANEGFYMIRPIYNREGYIEDFRLDDCNNRAAEFIGLKREQLLGLRASALKPDAFRDETMTLLRLVLEKGVVEEEVRVASHSPIRAKWVYRRIVRSSAGLALTIRDISDAKEQEQALADLANSDTLTKLPNRHWLTSFLPNAVHHASTGTAHLALMFIDLDNFKNVNDTLGHDAGDELLVQAAQRLRSAVRASDHVARLGGDEFVVILGHVDALEDVSRVARAIVNTISKPFSLTVGTGNEINASIGISMFPEDGRDAETLLKHADIAMYAAKAAGKGRYAFYHAHLSDSLILRLSKERALRDAVDNREFVVHYQPRVGVNSGQLTSMEALVRWKCPERGLVYPSEFIGMAEDIGLIEQIGEQVIEGVCQQVAQWRAQGLALVPVSVNVSPQQLKSGALSGFIASCIARHGIEPSLIEAELTESAVIDRSSVVTKELAALRSLGIKLMIDDFGTGYSSMAQLHRLDVDVLKVDQSFTRQLSEGDEGRLLFSAIMSMANALEICVVAEGVETAEQLKILQTLSCDEIQGNLISKAVAAGEMAQLILKRILLPSPRGPGRLVPV